MNEIIENEILNIKDMIYEINGVEVMLDSDLAKLYHVETKRINEAVKNNPRKFPTRYSWLLSIDETINLSRSKKFDLENRKGLQYKIRGSSIHRTRYIHACYNFKIKCGN